jgi:predicted nuclease of restriction endonuclease-like (RecB) superfamily
MGSDLVNIEYQNWLKELKSEIHQARKKLVFSINSQLIELYWNIGRAINEKQNYSNWGSKVIENLAIELKKEFNDIKGFSRRNLYAMRQFYLFYSNKYQFVPQTVAQLPWGHNRLIISKLKDIDEAEFYVIETIKNSWDRDTLEVNIKNNYYKTKGLLPNNFDMVLPENQSKMATEILKDPYNFDFLGLENDALEKAIEDELTKYITKFLIELGKGFAFVGKQVKIEVSENDYYIDMLFYHLELRAYIVIELKSGKFKPEYLGKLNFYLSAVDSQLKKENDNQSIGILLCKSKDKIEVEYALRDISKPIGISEYQLISNLPEKIKIQLPSLEEIEDEFNKKGI